MRPSDSVRRSLPRRVAAAVSVCTLALAGACGRSPAPPGPNVLLVTIDAVRADHVGVAHDGHPLTPHLDELARSGTGFESAYSAAAFTLPSVHTIATGEPPPVHRARFWTKFGNRFQGPTLAELFAERGYRTAFVSGHGLLGPYPVMRRGFDVFEDEREARGDRVVERARQFLDDAPGAAPFFLWAHIYEPHTPYAPEEQYLLRDDDAQPYRAAGPATFPVDDWLAKVPGADAEHLADRLYAAEVRAADAAFGRLMGLLRSRGLDGNTIVCVVADHGESLSWDPSPRWDHGWSVDRHLVHVPLLLAGPGVPAGRRGDLASHLDVAPTLVTLSGDAAPEGWLGRDLFGTAPAPPFVVVESSVPMRQDEPFYGVTDGSRCLRIDPATALVELVDERADGAVPEPVDLHRPTAAAEPFVRYWDSLSVVWRERALQLNDPSAADVEISPEQERVLALAGYLR